MEMRCSGPRIHTGIHARLIGFYILAIREYESVIARMISRRLKPHLISLLDDYPAVALLGPRQVGKTTLAHEVASNIDSVYLDLESPADRAKLSEPELYLADHENKLVILDEIQRVPELFQCLRGLIDSGRRKGIKSGRFLLLGSASMDLLQQSGESLAGRIAYLELAPLDVSEVASNAQDQLWIRGGFPDSLLQKDDGKSLTWQQNFMRTYLERASHAGRACLAHETPSKSRSFCHKELKAFNEQALDKSRS